MIANPFSLKCNAPTNWTLGGGLLTFTLNLRMFLDIFELTIERRKKNGKELFWYCGLMFVYEGLIGPTNGFKKSAFSSFQNLFVLFFSLLFLKLISCTIKAILPKLRDHISNTAFSELFFLLLCKAKKCLEKCVNGVWNFVTPLFTPLRSNFNSFWRIPPHLKCQTCSEGQIC